MSYTRITAVTIVIKNGAGKVPGLLAVLIFNETGQSLQGGVRNPV